MYKIKNDSTLGIKDIFTDAFIWLKKSRKHYPSSSDIWDFRQKWDETSKHIIKSFIRGTYEFDVQKKIHKSNGETLALWLSSDALILKVLTCLIQKILTPFLSRNCYHLKGNGGLKGAVNDVLRQYPDYRFFMKTDVRSYYDSIDHHILLMKLKNYIEDRKLLRYVWQFLIRTVEW